MLMSLLSLPEKKVLMFNAARTPDVSFEKVNVDPLAAVSWSCPLDNTVAVTPVTLALMSAARELSVVSVPIPSRSMLICVRTTEPLFASFTSMKKEPVRCSGGVEYQHLLLRHGQQGHQH